MSATLLMLPPPPSAPREWAKRLAAALGAGALAGAALDVFAQGPLAADHSVWTAPGLLITPPAAGFGPYLGERRYDILLGNSRRVLAGQPLRNVVDKARWF